MSKAPDTSPVNYLNDGFYAYEYPMWHHKRGLSQTATGYGKKLATTWKLRLSADSPGKRLYRVYCHIYSNVGSLYIVRKGVTYYIRDSEIQHGWNPPYVSPTYRVIVPNPLI